MAGERRSRKAVTVSEHLDIAATFDALYASLSGDEETPPEGFHTTQQWAKLRGKSRAYTSAQINLLLAAGKIERRDFRIKTGQLVRPVSHYRLAA